MSAPRTNIEKQKRQHRGPLIGMALVVVFGVGLIVYWLFEESYKAAEPDVEPAVESAVPSGTGEGTTRVP